jgi:hypothetical protein
MDEPKIRAWPCALHPDSRPITENTRKPGHAQRCLECAKINRRKNYAEHKDSPRSQYASWLCSARNRGITATITFGQWQWLRRQPCIYQNGLQVQSGIDRRDSRRGYVKGNCQPCCPRHNLMKNDIFTHEQMLDAVPRYNVQCGAQTPKRPSLIVRLHESANNRSIQTTAYRGHGDNRPEALARI